MMPLACTGDVSKEGKEKFCPLVEVSQSDSADYRVFPCSLNQTFVSLIIGENCLFMVLVTIQCFILDNTADMDIALVFFSEVIQDFVFWLIEVVRYFCKQLRHRGWIFMTVLGNFSLLFMMFFSYFFLLLLGLRIAWWFMLFLGF